MPRALAKIEIERLSTGFVHIRGNGPCEWAQPPHWPCDEETLRAHAFPEASDDFIAAALDLAKEAEATP